MFALVSHYEVRPERLPQGQRAIEEHPIPALGTRPGYGGLLLANPQKGKMLAVGLWASDTCTRPTSLRGLPRTIGAPGTVILSAHDERSANAWGGVNRRCLADEIASANCWQTPARQEVAARLAARDPRSCRTAATSPHARAASSR
jgi:hypothetical protein